MNQLVQFVNLILSTLTLLSDMVLAAGVLVMLVLFIPGRIRSLMKSPPVRFLSKYAYHFALIVALTATLGSLFYSEIAGFAPCELCWYQRILMYPQTVILFLAILKKDNVKDYLIALSTAGLVIASYHYYLQRGGTSILPCSTVGYSQSCSENFFMQFGYITIPVMASTAFLLIIVLMLLAKVKPVRS